MKRILAAVMCLVMIVALCAAMPVTASAKGTVYLTLAHNMAEDHAINVALVAWAEAVDAATNGEIQIDVMPGGTLGSEADCVSQIQAGQLEMTKVSAGTLANFNSAWNCVSVPYVFKDKDHLYNVMNGEIGQDLYNLTENDGFIGLAWLESGTRCFYTAKTPIRTPSDLKGLKIRTMDSQMAIDMMTPSAAPPPLWATATSTPACSRALSTALRTTSPPCATMPTHGGHRRPPSA